MNRGLARYHPALCFLFFALAIGFGMFFSGAWFLVASVVLSASYCLVLNGAAGLITIRRTAVLFLVLAVGNPLLNTQGETVLFTYGAGRPFTLEALYYGCVTGGMCVSVLLWFTSYHSILTSEKFMFLFGSFSPAVSLVFTMTLRLVPLLERTCAAIAQARAAVGKAPQQGTLQEKLRCSITVLSALTSWALENALVTADSMKSRGYGTGRRTHYAAYPWRRCDSLFAAAMGTCVCSMAAAWLCNGSAGIAAAAYAVLLALPLAIHIGEEMKWRFLRQTI